MVHPPLSLLKLSSMAVNQNGLYEQRNAFVDSSLCMTATANYCNEFSYLDKLLVAVVCIGGTAHAFARSATVYYIYIIYIHIYVPMLGYYRHTRVPVPFPNFPV